jgi:hypothetical protein
MMGIFEIRFLFHEGQLGLALRRLSIILPSRLEEGIFLVEGGK